MGSFLNCIRVQFFWGIMCQLWILHDLTLTKASARSCCGILPVYHRTALRPTRRSCLVCLFPRVLHRRGMPDSRPPWFGLTRRSRAHDGLRTRHELHEAMQHVLLSSSRPARPGARNFCASRSSQPHCPHELRGADSRTCVTKHLRFDPAALSSSPNLLRRLNCR